MATLFLQDKLTLTRYRLSLTWVPRYLILIIIIALYTAILLRVRHSFRIFLVGQGSQKRPEDSESTGLKISQQKADDSTATPPARPKLTIDPPCPHLERHGLVESSTSGAESSRSGLTSSTPQWEHYQFGSVTPLPPPSQSRISEIDSVPSPILTHHHDGSVSIHAPSSPGSQLQTLTEALRSPPPRHHHATDGASDDRLRRPQISRGQSHQTYRQRQPQIDLGEPMRARHRAIARHLRFLFLYPIVYFLLWLPSFVSHCLMYTDWYAARPSFALSCIAVAAVAAQCAVDSALYAWRERPRRLPAAGRAPRRWPSLNTSLRAVASADGIGATRRCGAACVRLPQRAWARVWAALCNGLCPCHGRSGSGARAERVAEARSAWHRRERETQDAIEMAARRAVRRKMSAWRRGGREKAWWDAEASVTCGTKVRNSTETKDRDDAEAAGGGDASADLEGRESAKGQGVEAQGLPTVKEDVE